MSKLDETCFIVQARLSSERTPQKMLRPFDDTNLFSLILDKLNYSSVIPKDQIFASVYEPDLKEIANAKGINIYPRSAHSAHNDDSLKVIYEWHSVLPYKYVVIVSGCAPMLKTDTIDQFVSEFVEHEWDNLFAVVEKKQYYWNKDGKLITPWPDDQTIMNTKAVEPTYEAAHTLYASRMDIIKDNRFMGDFTKPVSEGGIRLFPISEIEAFDIDYEWQFKAAEILYKELQYK